jgi:glycosyltransferase involved in cell wall biosynthesis
VKNKKKLAKNGQEKTFKPRVLILTHHDIASGSGGDIARVKSIASMLSDLCEVKLFGFRYLSSIYYSKKKPLLVLLIPFWTFTLLMQIARTDWDYVYCHNQPYIVILIHLLRTLLFKQYKIFYDAILTWRYLPKSNVYKKFRGAVEQLAGICADFIIVFSESSKNFFDNKKTLLIPTFVDTNVFKPQGKEKKLKVRSIYGMDDTDIIIGVIGPFYASDFDYNVPTLEFLQKNIRKFDKRIKFMVIGKCDRDFIVKCENIVYTGFVENYVDHLSALDGVLVIRKKPTDGAINRIVQAMAMGLPVFTNPIAAKTMDYATPNIDFFVFKEEELLNKINEIMFNKHIIERVSKNARKIVEKYYSDRIYKQKLRCIFKL